MTNSPSQYDTRVRLWCACGGAIEITRHPEHVAAVMEASWRAMHVQRGCRFVTHDEWVECRARSRAKGHLRWGY